MAKAKAKAEGIDLVGENGLLSRLTKTTLENVLAAEMGAHLGYAKHERSADSEGNSRNGPRGRGPGGRRGGFRRHRDRVLPSGPGDEGAGGRG
jgi:transposase-like protein